MRNFDIIGDVHGHAEQLLELLDILGYRNKGLIHPLGNTAIFVGDLINRGPNTIRVLEIIQKMHSKKRAFAVLGNHEFRLIQDSVIDSKKIDPRIKPFIPWLKEFPFFLDLPDLRVVHAAWHSSSIQKLKGKKATDEKFLKSTMEKGSESQLATRVILSGIKVRLPDDFNYLDRFKIPRKKARIRWWEEKKTKISGKNFFPACKKNKDNHFDYESSTPLESYHQKEKPVFFGHYCLPPHESKVNGNTVCLDGCVSCDKVLWGYRFKKENIISPKFLVHT